MLTYFDKVARGWQDIGENRWRIPGVTYVPNPQDERSPYVNGQTVSLLTRMRAHDGTTWILRTHPADVPEGIDAGDFHRDRYRRANDYRLAQVGMSLDGYSESWECADKWVTTDYLPGGVITRGIIRIGFASVKDAANYYFPATDGVRAEREDYLAAVTEVGQDQETGRLSKADMMRRTRAAKRMGYANYRDYVAKNPGDPTGAFLFSTGGMGGANVSADGKRETGRIGNAHA